MNFLLTFVVPAMFAVVFHMTFLRLSAFCLRIRSIGWSMCALFAAVSTCLLYILRSRDFVEISTTQHGALAAAASLLLQAILGSLVFGPVLLSGTASRARAAAKGALVGSLAFFFFLGAGLGVLSALDLLA